MNNETIKAVDVTDELADMPARPVVYIASYLTYDEEGRLDDWWAFTPGKRSPEKAIEYAREYTKHPEMIRVFRLGEVAV